MKIHQNFTSLDYTDCKQSAIYFDNVIPMDTSVFNTLLTKNPEVLNQLVPPSTSSIKMEFYLNNIPSYPRLIERGRLGKHLNPLILAHYCNHVKNVMSENPNTIIKDIGLIADPINIGTMNLAALGLAEEIYSLPNTHNVISPSDESEYIESSENDIRLSIMNLKLIDTDAVDWQHIIEFRKDAESIEKLKKFKIFFYSEYENKPQGYIEHDIQLRMRDYEEVCNSWGLKLKDTVIESLLSSTSILALTGGSILASFTGEPNMIEIASIGTTSVEIANLSFNIKRSKRKHNNSIKSHPMEFIFDTTKKLKQ